MCNQEQNKLNRLDLLTVSCRQDASSNMYQIIMQPSNITADVKKKKEYIQPLLFIEASEDVCPAG